MYRNKQCNNCRFCDKDVQIDMGCTMDVCKVAEKIYGCYSGLMCQEWKAKRNNEIIIEKKCPNYLPIISQINIKSGFKYYYESLIELKKQKEKEKHQEWEDLKKKCMNKEK